MTKHLEETQKLNKTKICKASNINIYQHSSEECTLHVPQTFSETLQDFFYVRGIYVVIKNHNKLLHVESMMGFI